MKKIGYIIVVMTLTFAAAALAQEGAIERDPFHPSEDRPAAGAAPSNDNAWGRDPFNNPLAGKVPALKEPGREGRGKGLTGIIYSADVRLAIIGGEACREGAMIGDKKLVNIRKQSVVFENATGGREEVLLEDFSIRK